MPTNTFEINKKLLEEIYKIYADAERQLLEKVAKRIAKGIKEKGWNEIKLKQVQQLKEEIEKIMNNLNKIAKIKITKGLINAYKKGQQGAEIDWNKIKPGKLPKTIISNLIPYHLQRLILETHNLVDKASIQILRNTMDTYRDIIAQTTTGILAGYETRIQAAQNALNMFADKGITGFVDKLGRRWELASYVEMAVRTASNHAAIQGHIDRQLQLGNDLIMVSSHAGSCPICAPWAGKVLSITGKTPNYPTLAQAKEAGLFHPNCKHTITAYFPFIDESKLSKHVHETEYDPKLYEAIQQQRYNERMIRKWKNREAVALIEVERQKAHNKILEWQAIQRKHVAKWNLRRNYTRESIRNRVGNAAKVKPPIEIPEIKPPFK